MERECQEECVLIHFDRLRDTIDRYLKKHSFCDECTKMVNKAYTMLVEDEDPVWPDLPGACKAPVPVARSVVQLCLSKVWTFARYNYYQIKSHIRLLSRQSNFHLDTDR